MGKEAYGMGEEDTCTMKLFNCYVTTDHRHKDTENLDKSYREVLEFLTSEESGEQQEDPALSHMLVMNPCFQDGNGGGSGVACALIERAQLFDDRSSSACWKQENPVPEHCDAPNPDSEPEDDITGFLAAQQPQQSHSTFTLLQPSAQEELINVAIEEHLIMVMEQERVDGEAEGPGGTRSEQDDTICETDAEVNFTKIETADTRKLWRQEDEVALQHYRTTENPITIMWHNVNGIGSFIQHLREEGASYFQPQELCPDLFGILEAKISQSRPEAVGLILVLKDLIEELTGHKYVEVRSLRRSTSRCGNVVFLKVSFLETREWWTWSSDLEVYDPTYMNLQSAGYECTRREFGPHNEWNRKPVGDGDGRIIQIWLGPDKRLNCPSKERAALRIFFVYTRNSSCVLRNVRIRRRDDCSSQFR